MFWKQRWNRKALPSPSPSWVLDTVKVLFVCLGYLEFSIVCEVNYNLFLSCVICWLSVLRSMLANHMHWFFSVPGDMEQPVEPSIFDIFNWIRQNGCEKKMCILCNIVRMNLFCYRLFRMKAESNDHCSLILYIFRAICVLKQVYYQLIALLQR